MAHKWQESSLELNGKSIHFWRTGRGDKPALVLVHGFSDNGATWTPIAREFEAEFDVVMPDMHGHGQSSRRKPGQAVDMSADLAALISALGLVKPIICGHSMGAMVTFQTAARYPGLPKAIVLEDPPWFPPQAVPPAGDGPTGDAPIVAWAKTLPLKTFDELLVQYRKDNPSWPEETVRLMCQSKKELDTGIVEELGRKMVARDWHWQDHAAAIPVPILVMAANPELGGIVTPEIVAEFAALNPRVVVSRFPSVGHLIRFDAPADFIAALRKFLAGLGG